MSVLRGSTRAAAGWCSRWCRVSRARRVGEVDIHCGREGERGVRGHLAAPVPGHGLSQLAGHARHGVDERVAGGGGVASTGGQRDGHGAAAGALDQGGHRAACGAADRQVTLPVPGDAAAGGLGGTLVDRAQSPRSGRPVRGCARGGDGRPARERSRIPGGPARPWAARRFTCRDGLVGHPSSLRSRRVMPLTICPARPRRAPRRWCLLQQPRRRPCRRPSCLSRWSTTSRWSTRSAAATEPSDATPALPVPDVPHGDTPGPASWTCSPNR